MSTMRERGPLGDLVVRLRGEANLSQEGLAKAAGVTKAVIKEIETGRTKQPSFDRVFAIGRALDLDEDSFDALLNAAGWNHQRGLGPLIPVSLVDDEDRFMRLEGSVADLAGRLERVETLLEAAVARLEDSAAPQRRTRRQRQA